MTTKDLLSKWEKEAGNLFAGGIYDPLRILTLIRAYRVLEEAIEFYAQKPQPDITSEFAKSAEEWGETCATWKPLLDLGIKAREALDEARKILEGE